MRKSLALALISAALVAALPAAAQILSPDDAAALFSQARDAFQKQDYKTAMEKLQPAAEAGNTEAEAMLAQAYVTGNQGLSQDYAKALMWNEKAAALGSAGLSESRNDVPRWNGRGQG